MAMPLEIKTHIKGVFGCMSFFGKKELFGRV